MRRTRVRRLAALAAVAVPLALLARATVTNVRLAFTAPRPPAAAPAAAPAPWARPPRPPSVESVRLARARCLVHLDRADAEGKRRPRREPGHARHILRRRPAAGGPVRRPGARLGGPLAPRRRTVAWFGRRPARGVPDRGVRRRPVHPGADRGAGPPRGPEAAWRRCAAPTTGCWWRSAATSPTCPNRCRSSPSTKVNFGRWSAAPTEDAAVIAGTALRDDLAREIVALAVGEAHGAGGGAGRGLGRAAGGRGVVVGRDARRRPGGGLVVDRVVSWAWDR